MKQGDWTTVETPRLLGRQLAMDHFDFIFRMHQDQRIMQHLGGLRSRYRTRRYMEHNLTHWREHGCGIWVLFDKQSDQPVGRGGLRHTELEGAPEVELAYGLNPEVWGQGLATEFAQAAVDIGLQRLGLAGICAVVHPENQASEHVIVKVGFEFEREIRYSDRLHHLYRCRAQ